MRQACAGHVFKVTVDPYVGKMGIFRITRARLRKTASCSSATGASRQGGPPVHAARQGPHRGTTRVAGDIVAVAKVDEMHFDAVLHDAARTTTSSSSRSSFRYGARARYRAQARGDEQRMWEIMTKLVDEDPCLKVEHVATTNETIVYGLARTAPARAARAPARGLQVRSQHAAAAHCLSRDGDGERRSHHRHKKTDRRAGQFGEVFLRIEPLARGTGFEFVDQVKGGVIPYQFIPAVEKGVREVLASGAIAVIRWSMCA